MKRRFLGLALAIALLASDICPVYASDISYNDVSYEDVSANEQSGTGTETSSTTDVSENDALEGDISDDYDLPEDVSGDDVSKGETFSFDENTFEAGYDPVTTEVAVYTKDSTGEFTVLRQAFTSLNDAPKTVDSWNNTGEEYLFLLVNDSFDANLSTNTLMPSKAYNLTIKGLKTGAEKTKLKYKGNLTFNCDVILENVDLRPATGNSGNILAKSCEITVREENLITGKLETSGLVMEDNAGLIADGAVKATSLIMHDDAYFCGKSAVTVGKLSASETEERAPVLEFSNASDKKPLLTVNNGIEGFVTLYNSGTDRTKATAPGGSTLLPTAKLATVKGFFDADKVRVIHGAYPGTDTDYVWATDGLYIRPDYSDYTAPYVEYETGSNTYGIETLDIKQAVTYINNFGKASGIVRVFIDTNSADISDPSFKYIDPDISDTKSRTSSLNFPKADKYSEFWMGIEGNTAETPMYINGVSPVVTMYGNISLEGFKFDPENKHLGLNLKADKAGKSSLDLKYVTFANGINNITGMGKTVITTKSAKDSEGNNSCFNVYGSVSGVKTLEMSTSNMVVIGNASITNLGLGMDADEYNEGSFFECYGKASIGSITNGGYGSYIGAARDKSGNPLLTVSGCTSSTIPVKMYKPGTKAHNETQAIREKGYEDIKLVKAAGDAPASYAGIDLIDYEAYKAGGDVSFCEEGFGAYKDGSGYVYNSNLSLMQAAVYREDYLVGYTKSYSEAVKLIDTLKDKNGNYTVILDSSKSVIPAKLTVNTLTDGPNTFNTRFYTIDTKQSIGNMAWPKYAGELTIKGTDETVANHPVLVIKPGSFKVPAKLKVNIEGVVIAEGTRSGNKEKYSPNLKITLGDGAKLSWKANAHTLVGDKSNPVVSPAGTICTSSVSGAKGSMIVAGGISALNDVVVNELTLMGGYEFTAQHEGMKVSELPNSDKFFGNLTANSLEIFMNNENVSEGEKACFKVLVEKNLKLKDFKASASDIYLADSKVILDVRGTTNVTGMIYADLINGNDTEYFWDSKGKTTLTNISGDAGLDLCLYMSKARTDKASTNLYINGTVYSDIRILVDDNDGDEYHFTLSDAAYYLKVGREDTFSKDKLLVNGALIGCDRVSLYVINFNEENRIPGEVIKVGSGIYIGESSEIIQVISREGSLKATVYTWAQAVDFINKTYGKTGRSGEKVTAFDVVFMSDTGSADSPDKAMTWPKKGDIRLVSRGETKRYFYSVSDSYKPKGNVVLDAVELVSVKKGKKENTIQKGTLTLSGYDVTFTGISGTVGTLGIAGTGTVIVENSDCPVKFIDKISGKVNVDIKGIEEPILVKIPGGVNSTGNIFISEGSHIDCDTASLAVNALNMWESSAVSAAKITAGSMNVYKARGDSWAYGIDTGKINITSRVSSKGESQININGKINLEENMRIRVNLLTAAGNDTAEYYEGKALATAPGAFSSDFMVADEMNPTGWSSELYKEGKQIKSGTVDKVAKLSRSDKTARYSDFATLNDALKDIDTINTKAEYDVYLRESVEIDNGKSDNARQYAGVYMPSKATKINLSGPLGTKITYNGDLSFKVDTSISGLEFETAKLAKQVKTVATSSWNIGDCNLSLLEGFDKTGLGKITGSTKGTLTVGTDISIEKIDKIGSIVVNEGHTLNVNSGNVSAQKIKLMGDAAFYVRQGSYSAGKLETTKTGNKTGAFKGITLKGIKSGKVLDTYEGASYVTLVTFTDKEGTKLITDPCLKSKTNRNYHSEYEAYGYDVLYMDENGQMFNRAYMRKGNSLFIIR